MKKLKERCDVCGKPGIIRRRFSRTYGKGPTLLLVENVPVVSCPNCEQSYLTAGALNEIERIRLHRRSLAKSRRVATVSFG